MSCTLVYRDWGTKLPHRRSECEEASEKRHGDDGVRSSRARDRCGNGELRPRKARKEEKPIDDGGAAHDCRRPRRQASGVGRASANRFIPEALFVKCIEPSGPGPVEGLAQSAFSVSLMPPNRKRQAAAMDPAAGGAGQQRQNKASAGKKAKKGSGSGSGGRWPSVKPKKDLQINRLKGTHLLTIPDFFTSAEAKTFIDVAESMGFTHQGSLGPLKGEAYRDNDRISVMDPLLAQAIWESGINRIFTDISVSGKVATGLNPNIRFYRYTEGQRFGRHIDESVDLGDGSKTYYTLLIYLSGKGSAKDSSGQALVGGETVFYDQRGGVVAEVAPVQGMALLHLHGAKCMLHEARVVKKNAKNSSMHLRTETTMHTTEMKALLISVNMVKQQSNT